MTERVTTVFEIEDWEESSFDEVEGSSKLCRASVVKRYKGELEGLGRVEQLAVYRPDGNALFRALERFRGRLGERNGTFVLEHEGTFAEGLVKSVWNVVPDSGTGDLEGLAGKIVFEAGHAKTYEVVFQHRFE